MNSPTGRHIIACFLAAALLGAISFAQEEVRYKDLYASLPSLTPENAYSQLRSYQSKNPQFCNVYYQLGLISEKWAYANDPLTAHADVDYFIYNTKLYLGLAKYYLDDKQARKYGAFFSQARPAPGKTVPGLKEIQDDIAGRMDSIQNYERHVDRIYLLLSSSSDFYNRCTDIFMHICRHNNMLKDIYLTANDSLVNETRTLRNGFDSALHYFDQYRQALDSFPLKNYHQRYSLRPIETYRLDGLTGSDFTRDSVNLWNYRQWVDELDLVLNNEIKTLRQDIDSVNARLDQSLAFYDKNPGRYGTGFSLFLPSQALKYKLGKYDFGSVVLHLIDFKESLIAYLALSRDSLNLSADSSDNIPFIRRSRYYVDMVTQQHIADSLLALFRQTAVSRNIRKYADFFQKNFPGVDQLNQFCSRQQSRCTDLLDSSFSHLSQVLLREQLSGNISASLGWKKNLVPIRTQHPDRDYISTKDEYVTYVQKEDRKHNLFLAGSFYTAGKPPVAFVACAAGGKTLNWLKTYDIADGQSQYADFGISLDLADNALYLTIGSFLQNGNDSLVNTLVKLDLAGNEQLKTRLASNRLCRWTQFDEINNQLYAIFHGTRFNSLENGLTDMHFSRIDSSGHTNWDYVLPIKGSLVDAIRMDENWLLFFNASAYQSTNREMQLMDNKNQACSGILCLNIKNGGSTEAILPYREGAWQEALKVVKLSSESVNILGFPFRDNNNLPGLHGNNPGKLFFLLVDSKGRTTYAY